MLDNHDGTCSFRSHDGVHLLTAKNGGGNGSFCVVNATTIGPNERFRVEFQPDGHVAIKSAKGTYLSVQPGK